MKTKILRLFQDKHGHVAVWQWPNFPILAWAVCGVASRMLAAGAIHAGLARLSGAFLFAWAYMELTKGVSPFRRILGLIVLAATVYGFFI